MCIKKTGKLFWKLKNAGNIHSSRLPLITNYSEPKDNWENKTKRGVNILKISPCAEHSSGGPNTAFPFLQLFSISLSDSIQNSTHPWLWVPQMGNVNMKQLDTNSWELVCNRTKLQREAESRNGSLIITRESR